MKHSEFFGLQYPTQELVALDSSSGNYPYKSSVNNAWLLKDPAELKRFRDMFPVEQFKLVKVTIDVEPVLVKYAVFHNGGPANSYDRFTTEELRHKWENIEFHRWKNNEFDTFAEALLYVKDWLGESVKLPDNFAPNTKYKYNEYDEVIEIRTIEK